MRPHRTMMMALAAWCLAASTAFAQMPDQVGERNLRRVVGAVEHGFARE